MSAPTIYHLSIERFRSIRTFSWCPGKGVNLILGGGDVGKTSILDAVALLLSPVNPANLSDTDYLGRNVEAGFIIEAILSLPPETGINSQSKPAWPWQWNGKKAVIPSAEATAEPGEPVYRIRVRGTEDLELLYEVAQPDGTTDNFHVALRRNIGLVRLSGDDRNDRDLRLVQGSALDRLLADKGLRSRLARDLADHDVKGRLKDGSQKALMALDAAFKKSNLPDKLDLALTSNQGFSVTALIGLTADRWGVQLPLASWGAGTRRIASLAVSEQNQGEAPITLVDEVERGLEPYRQRSLMGKLQDSKSQVFVTTHSPFALSAASKASLWYVDHEGGIGLLDSTKTESHRKKDPETFLAYLSVIAEGATEKGFVTTFLHLALKAPLEQHGVHVSDGGGHESALGLLEALSEGGLRFAGFADDEGGKYPERWQKVTAKLNTLMFRWASGCLEENVIAAFADDKLEALLTDPEDKKTGTRLRTLAERLEIPGKDFATVKAQAGTDFKALIAAAAMGKVPAHKEAEKNQYKSHAQCWFKSVAGGEELAKKVFSLGAWPTLKPQLLPFCNAVRKAAGLDEIQDLVP